MCFARAPHLTTITDLDGRSEEWGGHISLKEGSGPRLGSPKPQ